MSDQPEPSIATQIESLKPGDHLCCFYRTPEEKSAILTPFIRQGLARNEKVIYIMTGVRSLSDVGTYTCEPTLQAQWLSSGQFKVTTANDVYLSAGPISVEQLIVRWEKECEQALSEGYSALRVTSETEWVVTQDSLDEIAHYESLIQPMFDRLPIIALCQYNLKDFPELNAVDQLLCHPQFIAQNRVLNNRLYMPPNIFLDTSKREETLTQCCGSARDFSTLLNVALQTD